MTSVCILTNVHGPFDTRIFHKQARSLEANGYDVTLLAPVDEHDYRDGIDIVPVGTHASRIDRWANLGTVYQRARHMNADVYHLHDPELLPLGVALANRTESRVVYDVHEDFSMTLEHRDWVPDLIAPILTKSISGIQPRVADQVDAVVTATEWIARPFHDRGVDPCITVRNFPNIERIGPVRPTMDIDQKYLLGYVGGLSERRGLHRMLACLRRLVDDDIDAGLVLVGPFNEPDADQFTTEFIQRHGLDERVHLTGYLDYEDIFGVLSAADVGLILADPAVYEFVISTKMFEYMYCSLPVVATETPSVNKYLPMDAGVTVDYANPDDQYAAIKELLLDDQRRNEMGAQGREAVKETYNWSVEAQRLLELYDNLT